MPEHEYQCGTLISADGSGDPFDDIGRDRIALLDMDPDSARSGTQGHDPNTHGS